MLRVDIEIHIHVFQYSSFAKFNTNILIEFSNRYKIFNLLTGPSSDILYLVKFCLAVHYLVEGTKS